MDPAGHGGFLEITGCSVQPLDYFGDMPRSTAIVGDVLVVSADNADGAHVNQGKVWVFRRTGNVWREEQEITESTPGTDRHFGRAVAFDGTHLLVGQQMGYSGGGGDGGSAHFYTWNGSSWTLVAQFAGGMYGYTASTDLFASSVALDGEWAAVGVYGKDLGSGPAQGEVRVYRLVAGVWTDFQVLTASDGTPHDWFGDALAISDARLAIGAQRADNYSGAQFAGGEAYVFDFGQASAPGVWSETTRLFPPSGLVGNYFGEAIDTDGQRVVVGALFYAPSGLHRAGRAFVFAENSGGWFLDGDLFGADLTDLDEFGNSVAIEGDTVLVGAHQHDGAVPDDRTGAAYLFTRASSGWVESHEFAHAPWASGAGAYLGASVAFDGDTVVLSEPASLASKDGRVHVFTLSGTQCQQVRDDVDGNGVPDECGPDCNGNDVPDVQDVANGTSADVNANWIPDECECAVTSYCTAKVNSLGCTPVIFATGTPSLSAPNDDFHVLASNVLNKKFGLFFWGAEPAAIPFQGGTLCVKPPIVRTPVQSSGGSPTGSDCTGTYDFHFSRAYMHAHLLAPGLIRGQYWSRDPGFSPPNNVGLTAALAISICP
ncbi:MAG: FG-GAP repeat protein [Planctomycetes bacterium]|nr:FG-GAP repeat protein [Planctomycetota bacterium]